MEFDMKKKATKERLKEFAREIEEISERIGFKVSARGWGYLLEQEGLITKAEFDRVEGLINKCRKKGILPLDFTADEEGRKFSGVEIPDTDTPVEDLRYWINNTLTTEERYIPDWWDGEKYYIQMVVEKIDLKTLFEPVCRKYKIPIATCFDSKTEILTKNGWKKFTELAKENKVATMNDNGELIYQKPIKIINENYKGKMYHIKNRATDQLLTPNHNVYVQRQTKNLQFEFIPIEKVAHFRNLKFKKDVFWKGKEVKYFKLPLIKSNGGFIKKRLDMDLWLQFLGYYISEGSLNHKPKHSIYVIQLAQSKDKHLEIYKKMEKCIKKLGYNFYADHQSIQMSNKQLHMYLKQFGKCQEKYISREFLELSPRQLKILLEALIEGDGHKRKNRAVYITTSKQLANDVQELALKSGYYASVSLKPKSSGIIKGKKIKSEHQGYCVNICKARSGFRINHHKKDYQIIDYKGTIHCVEVPNGIIYVRRNGKPVWSGNSKGWSSMLQRAIYSKRFKEAEEQGLKPLLLYCGDHDPDGLRISDFLRKNLDDLKDIVWEDGLTGYDPSNLKIVRFGLNYDFIKKHNLTWIDNLITGTKKKSLRGIGLDNPKHPNHKMPYVQEYIEKFGVRKCEANAIVTVPKLARKFVDDTIKSYLGKDAEKRFLAKRQTIRDEVQKFRRKTGLDKSLKKALDLIDKEKKK